MKGVVSHLQTVLIDSCKSVSSFPYSSSPVCYVVFCFDSFAFLGMARVKYTAKEIDPENSDSPAEEQKNLSESE